MQAIDVLSFGMGDIGSLNRPVMLVGLEGWFDVASAATQAVNAFTSADHAVIVGTIDPDPFYDFTQQRPHVTIDDDIREIVWPTNEFVLQRSGPAPDGGPGQRDVVGLIGVEPHLNWRTYVDAIITRWAARQSSPLAPQPRRSPTLGLLRSRAAPPLRAWHHGWDYPNRRIRGSPVSPAC